MINSYYSMPLKKRKMFQLKLGLFSLAIILISGFIFYLINIVLLPLLFFIIPIIISLIAPFFDVPSLVEKQKIKYHSLFLLAEKESNGVIKIHGGTLFDYYFVLNKNMSGKDRTKFIILEYVKGVMNLTENIDEELIIEGTSYIINERTAEKIGLKKIKTNGFQKLILTYNYFNLMLSIYLAKKRIEFPNLTKVNTYQAKIKNIKKNEPFIKQLILKLQT